MAEWRTQELRSRDQVRLAGVHPYLAAKLLLVLDAMELLGFPMFVVESLRTDLRQQELYAQGRTTPGAIVTNADGIDKVLGGHGKSMHQRQHDGYGHAVDCAFLDDPTTTRIETWSDGQPWDLYGRMAEQFGITWGGRWQSIHDHPHVELSLVSPHNAVAAPAPGLEP